MSLQNKTAVVTGGSQGIGRAISLELAKNGANIAILYVGPPAPAEETVADLNALGVKAKSYVCDVSDFKATEQAVAAVTADFGGIDILINNAGITRDGLIYSMKEEAFDAVLATNLKGAFNMIKHCTGGFIKKRCGRIVNISSVAGIMGNAGQANYSAAKAGMIGLTKSVARELAKRGVTCNAVAPGFVQTSMTADLPQDKILEAIPMGRIGRPEDIAAAVAFLASDAAAYITGEVLRVDGGMAI